MIRAAAFFLLLGAATAQPFAFLEQVAEIGSSIYESAQQMLPQIFDVAPMEDEDAGQDREQGHMWKSFQHAHECRESCGKDDACKAKCPKPWEPFLKACGEFPSIKACYQSCNGKDCEACPRFSMDWLNRKFAKKPEKAFKIAEEKCPLMEKAHACHQACAPGDHGCHSLCPHMKDILHGHKHWNENLRMEARAARKCHHGCGTDGTCHEKCPKPWAPFMKTCHEIPTVQACHQGCNGTECQKCLTFTADWANHKFAKDPEAMIKMSETKCPSMEQAHACHKACGHGDRTCHGSCPRMTDIILDKHESRYGHKDHESHHKYWSHESRAGHEHRDSHDRHWGYESRSGNEEHESRYKNWGQESRHGHEEQHEHHSHGHHGEHGDHHHHQNEKDGHQEHDHDQNKEMLEVPIQI